jgi:hypothetical protein
MAPPWGSLSQRGVNPPESGIGHSGLPPLAIAESLSDRLSGPPPGLQV